MPDSVWHNTMSITGNQLNYKHCPFSNVVSRRISWMRDIKPAHQIGEEKINKKCKNVFIFSCHLDQICQHNKDEEGLVCLGWDVYMTGLTLWCQTNINFWNPALDRRHRKDKPSRSESGSIRNFCTSVRSCEREMARARKIPQDHTNTYIFFKAVCFKNRTQNRHKDGPVGL